MKRDEKGWKRAKEMKRWRDKKGGLKPGREDYLKSALGVLMSEWLRSQKHRGLSKATIETRRLLLRRFLEWCEIKNIEGPEWLSRGLLDEWLVWIENYRTKGGNPLAAASQEGMLRATNEFFGYLVERRVIDFNPLEGHHFRRCRGRTLPDVMSESEVLSLLETPDTTDPLGIRDRALLELLYSTGIRRKELISLQIVDLRLEKRVMVVRHGKGEKERLVPIGTPALYWLRRYLTEVRPLMVVADAPCDDLFLTSYGDRFSLGSAGHLVRKYLDETGFKRKGACHLLRHACATHMLEHGADLRTIQTLLGHSRIDTTEIYTHVTTDRMCLIHQKIHPRG
jgi:integrase/recombinase XerD